MLSFTALKLFSGFQSRQWLSLFLPVERQNMAKLYKARRTHIKQQNELLHVPPVLTLNYIHSVKSKVVNLPSDVLVGSSSLAKVLQV